MSEEAWKLRVVFVSAVAALVGGCGGGSKPAGGVARAALETVAPLPDFVVTAVKAPPSARPGDLVSVSVTVCNQGTSFGAAPVDLVLSSDAIIAPPPPSSYDPAADRLIGGTFFQLEAGACSTQSLQVPASPMGPDGTYFLGAVADFQNSLVELNETNNTSPASPIGIGSAPDFIVTAVKGPPSARPGEPMSVSVTVCNQGTSFGAAPVDLVLSSDAIIAPRPPSSPSSDPAADRLIGGAFVQLGVGACSTQSLQAPAFLIGPEGTSFLGAVADLPNSLVELNETNNTSPASPIGIGSAPDFIVTAVKAPPSAKPGDSVSVSVTVCNQGTAPGAAPVDLVLSSDAVIAPPSPYAPSSDPAADRLIGGFFLQLEAGTCSTRSLQAPALLIGPEGTSFLGAVADFPNSLVELNETNNVSSGTPIGIGSAPDFIVTAVRAPPSARPGEPVSVSVTVCNQGTAPGATPVDLVLSSDAIIAPPPPYAPSSDPAADHLIGGGFFQLEAGTCSTQSLQAPALLIGAEGTYFLGAVADLPNSLVELNETNNTSPVSPIGIGWGPDFIVTAVKGPPSASPGDSVSVSVTVCNQGTVPGAAPVDLVLSSDAIIAPQPPSSPSSDPAADRLIGGAFFQLEAGACSTQSLQASVFPLGPEGTYFLGAVADLANSLVELNETNNVSSGTPIGIGAAPDFIVTAVKAPPSARPGEAVSVAVTVCNQGTGPGAAPVDLVLSLDAIIAPPPPSFYDPAADRLIGGTFFQLEAGACSTQSLQASVFPLGPEGTYFLGAVADIANSLVELNETNNTSPASPIGFGWAPDFIVTAVKAPPSARPGDTVSVSVTVCNQGTAPGAAPVDLVLSSDATIAPPPPYAPSSDPAADRLIGRTFFQLEAGTCSTQILQAPALLIGPDGTYFLGAVAELPNSLVELNETNNVSSGTPIGIGSAPDFVVTSVKAPPSARPGDSVSVAVTVCNQGTAPGAAPVDLVLSSDAVIAPPPPSSPSSNPAADRLIGNAFFQLETGVCSTQSLQVPASPMGPDGTYFLGAVADLPNSLVELNETNNISPASSIGIGWGPDFIVAAVKAPPSARPGEPVSVSVTVCNRGTAPGAAPVDLVLSSDAIIAPPTSPSSDPAADGLIGRAFFQLEGGTCSTQSLQAPVFPLGSEGTYFLGAVADFPNSLLELNETNNVSSGTPIGIGWGPDFIVTAVKAPPSARPGDSVSVAVTVCNQGTSFGAAPVDLVLSLDAIIAPPPPSSPSYDPAADRLIGGTFFQLEAGACSTQSLQAAVFPLGPDGTYFLGAVADLPNFLVELNETNNVSSGAPIGIGSAPDFIVTAVKAPPSARPGDSVSVSVTACNQGTASGAASVDLVISSDGTIAPPSSPSSDPASDRLIGRAFFQLEAGACSTQSLQAPVFPLGPDGTYFLGAVADLPNSLVELNETNNASSGTPIGIGSAPDFVVTSVKAPPSARPGEPVSVSVTVCNQGTAPGAAPVDLVLSSDAIIAPPPPSSPSSDPAADRLIGGTFFQLEAGACSTQSLQAAVFPLGPEGTDFVGAVADLPNSLVELNETNNTGPATSIGIGWAPDFIVTAVKAPPSARPGDSVSVSVTVCNQGTAAGAAPVDLVLSSDAIIAPPSSPSYDPAADRLLGGTFVQLEAGACSTQSLQAPVFPLGPEGTYFLGAVADFPNSLVELNETNNTSGATPVGIGSAPDFVVTSVKGPPSAKPGDSMSVSVTVCNQGTAVGAALVDLVLSSDAIIAPPPPSSPSNDPTADRVIGGAFVQLEAGACSTQNLQAPASAMGSDGTYYLGAVADLPNSLFELSEANNTSIATPVGIGSGPDFVVTSVKGPPSARPGDTLSVSVTVCNQGTAPGAAAVDLAISSDATIAPPVSPSSDPAADRLIGGAFFQLEAGACSTQSLQVPAFPLGPEGTYFLGAVADLPNSLVELNEANNTSAASPIGIGWAPDFVVTTVEGPPSARPGDSMSVSVTVCNQGTAPGFAPVDLVLSLDAVIAPPRPSTPSYDPAADRLIGGTSFQLDAGACSTQTLQAPAFLIGPEGTYFLGAVADLQSSISELNEANNASVGSPIDLR